MAHKRLNVNLAELVDAMDQAERDFSDWYLDLQTGEVILVNEEVVGELENEELDDQEVEGEDEIVAAENGALPAWQLAERELAARILKDTDGRYVRIPEFESLRSFGLMRRFAAGVADGTIRDQLEGALEGGKAFRRFKNVLLEYPAVRQQWFDYAGQRKLEWAIEWLESLDITSTWERPKA